MEHKDVKKLTDAELEELILLVESGAMERTFLKFMPHDAQGAVMTSTANETLFIGGNQGGKTETAVNLACMFATGDYPKWFPDEAKISVPNRGRICGPSAKNWALDILEPKLRKAIPSGYVQKWVHNSQNKALEQIMFYSGSVIDVMSYRMEKIEFESWTGNWAMFDEPPDREKYIATVRGLAALNGRIYFFLTPLEQPWIYQISEACRTPRLFGSKTYFEDVRKVDIGGNKTFSISTRVVPMMTDDNLQKKNWLGVITGGMSESGLANFLSKLDPAEEQVRRYGKFIHLQGLIYREFEDGIHITDGDVPKGCTMYMALDPADSRPHAVAWYAVDGFNSITCVYDEEIDGNLSDLAERIKEIEAEKGWTVAERILDPNKGRTPTSVTRNTWQEELDQRGLWFNTDVCDDIELGHQKVRAALAYDKNKPIDETNKPRLYFSRNGARNTIFGIKNYVYEENANKDANAPLKSKPQNKYKDFPDCLRYLVMYEPVHVASFQQDITGSSTFSPSDFGTSRSRG